MATLSSGRLRGGKDEEAQLLVRFLARGQNELEEKEIEGLMHLIRVKNFCLVKEQIWHDFGQK